VGCLGDLIYYQLYEAQLLRINHGHELEHREATL
jgi:hypothetical protein